MYKNRSYPIYPPQPVYDPKYLEWKMQKALRLDIEWREKERRNKEFETRQDKERIAKSAEIDKNTTQITDSLINDPISQTLHKKDYIFQNQKVIIQIAKMVRYDFQFSAMVRDYGKIKGVYEALLENPNLKKDGNYVLRKLIAANKEDIFFLNKVFSGKLSDSEFGCCCNAIHDKCELLKKLLSENKVPALYVTWAQDRVFELENSERILNGDICSKKDLEYAEKEYYCSKKYKFLKGLAQQSKKSEVLSSVSLSAKQNLRDSEISAIYWILLDNPNIKYTYEMIDYFLNHLTDKNSLNRLKPYCEKKDTDFTKWMDKMQALGFMSKRERKKEVNKRYPVEKESLPGCVIFIIIIIEIMYFLVNS